MVIFCPAALSAENFGTVIRSDMRLRLGRIARNGQDRTLLRWGQTVATGRKLPFDWTVGSVLQQAPQFDWLFGSVAGILRASPIRFPTLLPRRPCMHAALKNVVCLSLGL